MIFAKRLFFLLLIATGGSVVNATEAPPSTLLRYIPAQAPQWTRTHLRVAHLGPINMSDIEFALDAGANVVSANINDQVWRIGEFREPSSEDKALRELREFIATVHARGAKVVGYVAPLHVPAGISRIRESHADWLATDYRGNPLDQMDFISPYRDAFGRQLELLGKLGLDGIWLDGYSPLVPSYSRAVRDKYREATGNRELPADLAFDNPADRNFLSWYRQEFLDCAYQWRQSFQRGNPERAVIANFSGLRDWVQADEEHAWRVEYPCEYQHVIDVPSMELWWFNPGDPLVMHLNLWSAASMNRGNPVYAWPRNVAHTFFGRVPRVELLCRHLNPLGNLATTAEVVFPPGSQEDVRAIFSAIRAREPWLVGSRPLSWGAIVVDRQTRELYGRLEPRARYMDMVYGAFRAASEEHLQLDFISSVDLEENRLSHYKVLVIPQGVCLSDRALYFIREFVRRGGGLVATGMTSAYSHDGRAAENFRLADLFGVNLVAQHDYTSIHEPARLFVTEPHPVTADPLLAEQSDTYFPEGHHLHKHLSCACLAVEVTAAPETTVLAVWSKDGRPPRHPALVTANHGAGKVVYSALTLDQFYYNYSGPFARKLLTDAMRYVAAAAPAIEVAAPLMVRTTFAEQPAKRRLLVHLLNDASSYGQHSASTGGHRRGIRQGPEHTWPLREEIIPVRGITIRFRDLKLRQAFQQPEGIELQVERDGSDSLVTVPELWLHSIVVVEQE